MNLEQVSVRVQLGERVCVEDFDCKKRFYNVISLLCTKFFTGYENLVEYKVMNNFSRSTIEISSYAKKLQDLPELLILFPKTEGESIFFKTIFIEYLI